MSKIGQITLIYCTLTLVKTAVLDPSLYLAPSPPLLPTSKIEQDLWSQPVESRIERDVDNEDKTTRESTQTEPTATEKETMDKAETFWPSGTFGLRSIHIPLTFRISGTYGGSQGTGVMASSYTGLDDGDFDSYNNYDNYRNYGLAGSGYMYRTGNTKIRLFGNSDRPSWSGWGNGKWGHYGKG